MSVGPLTGVTCQDVRVIPALHIASGECRVYGVFMKYLLVILLLVTSLVQAEVYKSINEKGEIVFTDQPTPGAERIQLQEKIDVLLGEETEYRMYGHV